MKIKFELTPTINRPISYLSRGHISFENHEIRFSSKDRTPDQSCKLFFAIVDLFDLFSTIKNENKQQEYEFIAADSSFGLLLQHRDGIVTIKQSEFGDVPLEVFAKSLKEGVDSLFQSVEMKELNLGALQYDFDDAIKMFDAQFGFS